MAINYCKKSSGEMTRAHVAVESFSSDAVSAQDGFDGVNRDDYFYREGLSVGSPLSFFLAACTRGDPGRSLGHASRIQSAIRRLLKRSVFSVTDHLECGDGDSHLFLAHANLLRTCRTRARTAAEPSCSACSSRAIASSR